MTSLEVLSLTMFDYRLFSTLQVFYIYIMTSGVGIPLYANVCVSKTCTSAFLLGLFSFVFCPILFVFYYRILLIL